MEWLQQNFVILLLQAVITVIIGLRARTDSKRQKEIDAKADKVTVGLKFKYLESEIEHEKELRLLANDQQIKEIGEVKTLLRTVLDKIM